MRTFRTAATVLAAAALTTGGLVAAAASASASTPSCGNTALAVSASRTDGAAGHGSMVLAFRNTSKSTCSIYGYPGFDAVAKNGKVLAHAARTLHGFAGGAKAEKTIVVKPGAYASARVEWMNFNPATAGPCAFSTTVATTPANTAHTVHFIRSVSACSLQVHPTVAGTTGNG